MLVILSDVHLTDGSSGTTIDPRAFRKFSSLVKTVIGNPTEAKIRDVEIVLLGDIFDVIRSETWLRDQNRRAAQPIRPWSKVTDKDSEGWNLEKYTNYIVDDIVNNPKNKEAIGYLDQLREDCAKMNVKATLSYLIGNHDWLINRYASTRGKIADLLSLPNKGIYAQQKFAWESIFTDYNVLARHGDCYDPFNYQGNRDDSSMGDGIVIDLLNHFPYAVRDSLGLEPDNELVKQLKEIDNIRPLLDVPAWIHGVCQRTPLLEKAVHQVWNDGLDKFFSIPFIESHSGANYLKMALELASQFSFVRLKEIMSHALVRNLYREKDEYRRFAAEEQALKNNSVRYVIYGHTHVGDQVPLLALTNQSEPQVNKLYFNSGTWRKVFEHTICDKHDCHFIGWDVMTFVVFYLDEEKGKGRDYEVWSASLGGYEKN